MTSVIPVENGLVHKDILPEVLEGSSIMIEKMEGEILIKKAKGIRRRQTIRKHRKQTQVTTIHQVPSIEETQTEEKNHQRKR